MIAEKMGEGEYSWVLREMTVPGSEAHTAATVPRQAPTLSTLLHQPSSREANSMQRTYPVSAISTKSQDHGPIRSSLAGSAAEATVKQQRGTVTMFSASGDLWEKGSGNVAYLLRPAGPVLPGEPRGPVQGRARLCVPPSLPRFGSSPDVNTPAHP